MKWFLGTYTSRFNRRHKLFGHRFSGRYKSLIVDGPDRAFPLNCPPEPFARVEDADFNAGTDTFNDQLVSFVNEESSGVEGRRFAPRRVRVVPKIRRC